MSVPNITSATFAGVKAQAPNSIATIFAKYLQVGSNTKDVFSKFEGPDGAMGFPVCRKTELSSGAGKKVEFTTKSQLAGRGRLGEQTLRGNEEVRRFGTHEVEVDYVRHAEAITRKQLAFMAAGGSVVAAIGEDLADWFGRRKQTDVLHRLRGRAQAGFNIIYPNASRPSVDALLSADVFSTSLIGRAAAIAGQNGAKPLGMSKGKSGAEILKYMFFAPEQVFNPLQREAAYTNALAQGQVRGYGNNELFEGGIADWLGQKMFHWTTVDPDCDGPVGSMLDPRARLGTAIASGTAAVDITGGSSTTPLYFEFFPGYARQHFEEEVIAADTHDYYVVIFNHIDSAAGGDAGKFGFYRFTGSSNNGNKLTSKNETGDATTGAGGRLAATTSVTKSAKIGDVTWDANKHTVAHPAGAPIFLANRKGVVYGWATVLGQNAVLRAYGGGAMGDSGSSVSGKIQTEDEDYGMIKGHALEAVYGTDVWLDTLGRPTNYLLIPCAYQPNGISLPEVTS